MTIANDPPDTRRPRPGTEVVVVVVMVVVVCGVWCMATDAPLQREGAQDHIGPHSNLSYQG